MKKLLALILIIALGSTLTFAQKKGKEVKEKVESDKFKMEGSKIIPKLERLALAQLTVNYKLTTTAKTIVQEKSSRKIAGARVSAYLEFTDGDMTKAEYQEITDHFYRYFQKALKKGGIDTVGWNAITAHEFYQKVSDDDEEDGDDLAEEKGGNKWVTVNALNGKTLHHGMVGFAGGKGKRAMDFTKDLNATAGYFKLEVDFADVVVNLDIKTRERKDLYGGWYYPEVTKQTYTWAINPEMRIGNPSTKTMPLLAGQKGWPEWVMMWNDIESHATYADNMTEDISKGRSTVVALVAFRKELTPVLIQTTREKYKAAAKKTVEKYADTFVEMCQKKKKD